MRKSGNGVGLNKGVYLSIVNDTMRTFRRAQRTFMSIDCDSDPSEDAQDLLVFSGQVLDRMARILAMSVTHCIHLQKKTEKIY